MVRVSSVSLKYTVAIYTGTPKKTQGKTMVMLYRQERGP